MFGGKRFHIYDWTELEMLWDDIKFGIFALKSIHENQENAIDKLQKKIDSEFNDEMKNENYDESDRASISTSHSQECDTLNEISRLQHFAIFTSSFSLFEGKLKSICDLINNKLILNIDIKKYDSKLSDIEKYKLFISQNYLSDLGKIENEFKELDNLRLVRKIIVHFDGYFTDDKLNKLIEITTVKYSKLDNHYKLYFKDPSVLISILDKIYAFFESLTEEIDKIFLNKISNFQK